MDQERSETIAMIRDSVAAVVPPGADLKRIRQLRYATPGFDRAMWREMCGMGWPGLRVPESQGGSGLGMQEFCALVEGLGVGLVPEPLIPCAMAARLLADADINVGQVFATSIDGANRVMIVLTVDSEIDVVELLSDM